MCLRKSKMFLVLLVLVLASVPLYSWSPRLVGEDSRDALIHNQEMTIERQVSQISELQAALKLKENEIASLQESLTIALEDLAAAGSDSELLLKQVSDLETLLATAKTDSKTLETSLNESVIELIGTEVLVETATEIVETEPSKFGGSFALGGIYAPDGTIDAEIVAGLTYGMFGIDLGIVADVDADMYLPSQWSYKAGIRVNF